LSYVRREFPEWSWSESRRRMLTACPRRYYYHYYAAHNGWDYDAPPTARRAYRLKNLTNLHSAFGEALHQTAVDVVRRTHSTGVIPTVREVTDTIRGRLNEVYHSAHHTRRQWEKAPKRHPMLHEVYYAYGPSQTLIDTIKKKLQICVPALLDSKSLKEVGQAGTEVITVDSLDHFYLLDTKTYAVPDLLYRRIDGQWVLVDWKTGDEDPADTDQLKVYALYARNRHSVLPHQLICRLEYLYRHESQELTVSEDDLRATERDIARSMTAMRSLLVDAVENRPQPIDAFPMRPGKFTCQRCNFYELCLPQLEQEGFRESQIS
jgi:hypothetical protein